MGSQFEAAGDRIAGVLAAIFLPLLYFDWWGFLRFLYFASLRVTMPLPQILLSLR